MYKTLLSLPPNLVNSFYELEGVDPDEWFCASDPVGARLGSGGGTTWLLESSWRNESIGVSFEDWLKRGKRILLHAGGQSRRLPAYAPSGKVLTPIPVFRWARGQRLSQNLLSLQLPLYRKIMERAPSSLHTLIASGDVYIRSTAPLQNIPDADVVCYGLWVDSSLATHHGVFVSDRRTPDVLDFMLQKPSLEELREFSETHLFLMDIGIWLLSDKAVGLLQERSKSADGERWKFYDLYSDFGRALGTHPAVSDEAINQLSVAILPLQGGEFYHYGTTPELISSTLAVQNLVADQRLIMQRKIKPHPAMFVQNAMIEKPLTSANSNIWIENSMVGKNWTLNDRHVITGVPVNDWHIELPAGICLDVVPWKEQDFVARPYGYHDLFKGARDEETTLWMGMPVGEWMKERDVMLPVFSDLQNAPLFPVCHSVDELGLVLRWMVGEPDLQEGKTIWETADKVSANQLSDEANLHRLFAQREAFRMEDWALLANNHSKSVFYQLDLAHAASEYVRMGLKAPDVLPADESLMKQIHNRMLRSRIAFMEGKEAEEERQAAFALLREGLTRTAELEKMQPRMSVYPDQIVWGRCPVRIDLAGGWTDTPPYCLFAGGNVVNVAIELNGQSPLQVYIKPSKEPVVILRSIDLGAMEVVKTWDELMDFRKIGSPFSIPKAALSLAGFLPRFSEGRYASLEEQLKSFGCGLEITLLAAIPAGSGLGTSSILAATVLGSISDFCGLGWDKAMIGYRTLILEQLLTTGGGWQDQFGGVLHGLKLLQTNEGFRQYPQVRWLPEFLFTDPEYQSCHVLYYTGITRVAKSILEEIVQGMFLNSHRHLELLSEMKEHALALFDAIQEGDFEEYGKLVLKSWEQNKALDKGTNPPSVEAIIHRIKDWTLGYKLPGAGGGGYLYMVAKDPEAASRIRQELTLHPVNANARLVEMSLSEKGLQISRS